VIKWGALKSYILSALLKDPQSVTFTPDMMFIFARWGCVEISQHTAEAATKLWAGDGVTTQFPLPDDMIERIDKAGLVWYKDSSEIDYLDSVRRRSDMEWPIMQNMNIPQDTTSTRNAMEWRGFWEWPSNTLTLGFTPGLSTTVGLEYFRSWAAPQTDDDVLRFPHYLEQPFAYFVAAYATDALGFQSSDIRQWNTKRDSGEPEQNPLHRQSEFYIKQAYRLLSKISPQDRETFYEKRGR